MTILNKLSQKYKKLSIQFVISLSFTAIAVVSMVLLGLVLSFRFSASTNEMISEESRRVLDQVNLNMDAYLRNMMRVSDSMYYRVIKNIDLSVDSLEKEMNLLFETNREAIVSIAVFSQEGDLVAATPIDQIKSKAQAQRQSWFISAVDKTENLHFSTPHVQNLFEDPDYRYKWVISLSRAVELTNDGDTIGGVLLVDMNFRGIEQVCKDVNIGEHGYIYLINGEGEIVYHPRQQLLFSDLLSENNLVASNYEDGNHRETFENASRLVTVKTVGYTGWKIVGVIPLTDVAHDASQVQLFAMVILFFIIFLLSFVNLIVSSIIANPIKQLEESVKRLESGATDVDIAIKGSYEIQQLGLNVRAMVARMRQLMDDLVQQQKDKRKSELNALQSQINPHFLYNTLDSIVWMIENERTTEAVRMVTSLARLFRISISRGKNIITIGEELEHARHYLTIQQMRYKNKFTVEINTEPDTLQFATIKLIVQPLLENAIYHGMESMSGEGQIQVNTYLCDDELFIDVIDNGLGMTPELVALLLSGDPLPSNKGSGFGLRNVMDRIQLYFGKDYGLKIISEPDDGTTIRIHLPQILMSDIDVEEGKRQ